MSLLVTQRGRDPVGQREGLQVEMELKGSRKLRIDRICQRTESRRSGDARENRGAKEPLPSFGPDGRDLWNRTSTVYLGAAVCQELCLMVHMSPFHLSKSSAQCGLQTLSFSMWGTAALENRACWRVSVRSRSVSPT